jgi:hypothetical protein
MSEAFQIDSHIAVPKKRGVGRRKDARQELAVEYAANDCKGGLSLAVAIDRHLVLFAGRHLDDYTDTRKNFKKRVKKRMAHLLVNS